MHNCERCGRKKLRSKYGCNREFKKKVVRKIECICSGTPVYIKRKEIKCPICKGTGELGIHTCPKNIVMDGRLLRIRDYFEDYLVSKLQIWPDGQRRKTPLKLQEAFNILLAVYNDELRKKTPKDPESGAKT